VLFSFDLFRPLPFPTALLVIETTKPLFYQVSKIAALEAEVSDARAAAKKAKADKKVAKKETEERIAALQVCPSVDRRGLGLGLGLCRSAHL
jgi:hypothetical protein